MTDFTKDTIIGLLILTGVWSFISAQFIISTIVFAGAALLSNITMRPKLTEQEWYFDCVHGCIQIEI